jgi:hypothetical protein
MILYYHLLTNWNGLGDSTKLSRMGLSQSFYSLLHSHVALLHWLRGSVLWLRGELACVQGDLFVLFELWIGGLCSLLSMFFLGCVEPLPLPKGSETCSSSSDLALCFSFGFRSLVGVFF